MKKTIIISGIILLTALVSFGQVKSKKVDILWGKELKESKRSTLSDIVGYDETGFYALKVKYGGLMASNSTITLEHFNYQMNKTKSVELELKEQKKDKNFEFIVQLNGELYLFTSFKNQKVKKNYLFVQSINKKTLQLNRDIRKIAEISYTGKSKRNSGNYDYDLSRDSTKILVYYNLPFDKGEREKFGFHVFDNKLNEIWEKRVTLPYKEELFDIEDYNIDNNGNVHLLGVIFKDKRKAKRKGAPNYKYQILSYYDKGNELRQYPVSIPGKFLTDMQIAINNQQDIICAGFYSEEGTFSIIGSYFLRIDEDTKQIEHKSFKEFGIDFITQNMTKGEERRTKKKAGKGKDVELFQYDLDNIILRTDGGAVLLGEQYYVRIVTTTTTSANGATSTRTTYYYYYNDIIAINISPDGDIEWAEKIPKRQITTNDGGFFSSYDVTVVKDKLYFIFNDNPRNLHYTGQGKLHNFNKGKESLVVLVELDGNGKQTREALFSVRDADIITRPKVCEQISDNEVVLFGQRKKTQRFARITFKM